MDSLCIKSAPVMEPECSEGLSPTSIFHYYSKRAIPTKGPVSWNNVGTPQAVHSEVPHIVWSLTACCYLSNCMKFLPGHSVCCMKTSLLCHLKRWFLYWQLRHFFCILNCKKNAVK
ncbi:uncharacterized protein LOC134195704 [Corticium candelabrum]|uniref:uncharacterized protein LOC134195704 n=1 Tax=Corticium candelabrum TaxID=121492 RepID=UPI002E276E1F|nr:uncharacterized protein LOC134195704 [Corticium candelabrum]